MHITLTPFKESKDPEHKKTATIFPYFLFEFETKEKIPLSASRKNIPFWTTNSISEYTYRIGQNLQKRNILSINQSMIFLYGCIM